MRRRWERLAAALLALAATACADGYPGASEPDGPLDAHDRVRLLERLVASGDTEVRSMALRTPCTLHVRWKAGPATDYGVLRLQTLVDTDAATGHFVLALRDTRDITSPLLLSTRDWATMTMVRTEVNQLRAACAEWRRQDAD